MDRITEIGKALRELLITYKPNAVAIEKIFLGKNVDVLLTGHARGICIYESKLLQLPVYEMRRDS